jgi:hypothetical protein
VLAAGDANSDCDIATALDGEAMKRPDEIDKCRDNLRRPGYVDAGTCRITSEGLSEILDWIDHLEANQVQVIPLRAFDLVSQEVLHGTWSEIKDIDVPDPDDQAWGVVTKADGTCVMSDLNALVAVRPKQQRKRTAENVVLQTLSEDSYLVDGLDHIAQAITTALREANLLKESE